MTGIYADVNPRKLPANYQQIAGIRTNLAENDTKPSPKRHQIAIHHPAKMARAAARSAAPGRKKVQDAVLILHVYRGYAAAR